MTPKTAMTEAAIRAPRSHEMGVWLMPFPAP